MTFTYQMIGSTFAVIYIPLMLWVVVMIIRDAWRARWSQRFRMTREEAREKDMDPSTWAKGDYSAFIDTLFNDSYPSVAWSKVVAYPIVGSIGLTMVWWIITVVSMWVYGL